MATWLLFGVPFLILVLGAPLPVWAQGPREVGVVTALSGKADLKRGEVPQLATLKLRDPLAVRDVVETREESLARILLLGKATVTVRELSRFEIREETRPDGTQRAGIDLVAGRIRVMVAPRLMRAGDEIQIRTPNAIVGIRGSEGVVEVMSLPDGTPRTVVTGVAGEFEVTLPSTRPIAARADVESDAGGGIRLAQLPIPGGGTLRRLERLEITGLAGLQRIVRSVITEQNLQLFLRGFQIRHIRDAQTSADKEAGRARGETTRDGSVPGPGETPGVGGPVFTPPNVILPTTVNPPKIPSSSGSGK